MKRFLEPVAILLLVVAAVVLQLTGCRLFGRNPGGPDAPFESGVSGASHAGGLASSVKVRVVLPPVIKSDGNLDISSESAPVFLDGPNANVLPSAGASVTVTLTLIHIGNATDSVAGTNWTTVLSKTAPVDGSGSAEVSFSGVPALSCIAEISIVGGRIASFSNFRGAADLLPDVDNVIDVSPKDSNLRADFVAAVMMRVVDDPALFSMAVKGLTARVEAALAGFDYGTGTVQQALDAFQVFSGKVPSVEIGKVALLHDEVVSANIEKEVLFASDSHALNGLVIRVPRGAFDADVHVRLLAAEISSHSFGMGFAPATPLISIDNGGRFASMPMTVKIPVRYQDDDFAMVYEFDPTTGILQAIPVVDRPNGFIVVATNRFLPSGISASVQGNPMGRPSIPGFIVFLIKKNILDNLSATPSDFKPEINRFSFGNGGSALTQGGICTGQSISAFWYFKQRRSPQLFGLLDNNGSLNKSGIGATPEIPWDDTLLYAFAAVVHHDQACRVVDRYDPTHPSWAQFHKVPRQIQDQDVFNAFRESIWRTRQPQLIGMWGKDADNKRCGQVLIVYQADPDALWVIDPNYPIDEKRKIEFGSGALSAYRSALSLADLAAEKTILFSDFQFLGGSTCFSERGCMKRWDDMEVGKIRDEFAAADLAYDLIVEKIDGGKIALSDGFTHRLDKLNVSVSFNDQQVSAPNIVFIVYDGLTKSIIASGSPTVAVPLAYGENRLGFFVRRITSDASADWLDFRWITVNSDAFSHGPVVSGVLPETIYAINFSQTITLCGWGFAEGMIPQFTAPNEEVLTLASNNVLLIDSTKATITIPTPIQGTWWVTVKNPNTAWAASFSFEVRDPMSVVEETDGFDYPIDDRSFKTERLEEEASSDGWFNAVRYNEYKMEKPFNEGSVGGYHLGADWCCDDSGATLGEPVYAVANGVIVFAGNPILGVKNPWGNVVILRHRLPSGKEYESVYAHLKTIDVSPGFVGRGSKIGEIGDAEAYYEKAHLHFEIRDSSCKDWGLPGDSYGYSSSTRNPVGWRSPVAFIDANRPQGASAPAPLRAPDGFKVTDQGDRSLSFSWNAVPEAACYKLYYTDVGPITYSTEVLSASTSALILQLETRNNTTYYAVVTAVNANASESNWSEEVSGISRASYDEIDFQTVKIGSDIEIKFENINTGSFRMGSNVASEPERSSNEGPQRTVTISAFQMQSTEVTQEQYERIMGLNPSFFIPGQTAYSSGYEDTKKHPVENVSWYDAIRFCNTMSGFLPGPDEEKYCYVNKKDGFPNISDSDTVIFHPEAKGFRLPTEAEWEYACRDEKNSTARFFWGNSTDTFLARKYCWFSANCFISEWSDPHSVKGGTQPVGETEDNDIREWKLRDMSGNVSEWCWDRYADSYQSADATNPLGSESGSLRVARGGNWRNDINWCRSAARHAFNPSSRNNFIGFRVVRKLQ